MRKYATPHRRLLFTALAIVALLAVAALTPGIVRYFEIDGCLDEGGAWRGDPPACAFEIR
jgi:hypothetical protein